MLVDAVIRNPCRNVWAAAIVRLLKLFQTKGGREGCNPVFGTNINNKAGRACLGRDLESIVCSTLHTWNSRRCRRVVNSTIDQEVSVI